MLFPSVPQVDLIPKMDLVIGHGGNNSIGETLAAGKPLIVLPVGGEQGDNASRVEYLKVGLRLDIKRFTGDEIRRAVERIRTDSTFSFRAKEIKAAIDRTDGPQTASDCIEWLNRNKRPLHRPPGFPLTVTKDDMSTLTTEAP
jgi:UDP:flavonoid glycosyltransferase YjiC (YdhE family)